MSFILDALRKSEHERQRSALPSLAQVPVATRPAEVPRWVLLVIGGLAAAVLVLGGAWWQSTRGDDAAALGIATRTVEVPLPTPAAARDVATLAPSAPVQRAPAEAERPAASLAATARATLDADTPATARPALGAESPSAPAATTTPAESGSPAKDDATLPSAAALAAEGIALPALRLELHAYSDNRASRFVFINGRRYIEGERLPEGPELLAIEPRGAVLRYAGHRFLLVPE